MNYTLGETILYVYTEKLRLSEQRALVYLYETLIDLYHETDDCNELLHTITTTKEFDLAPDALIHILNALSPISNDLSNWKTFVDFAKSTISSKLGSDETENIFRFLAY